MAFIIAGVRVEILSEIKLVNYPSLQELVLHLPQRVKREIADGLDHATRSFLAYFFKNRLQGRPGVKAKQGGLFHRFRRVTYINGKRVFLRTQAYRNESISRISKSLKDPLNMKIEMFSESKVVGIHERGGVVSGHGSAMPIPLNEKARAMSPKMRNSSGLEVMEIGNKLFLGKKRRRGKPELFFLLSKQIRIPARLGYYSSWEAHQSRQEEILEKSVSKAIEKL